MGYDHAMKIAVFAPDLEGKTGWSRYALDLVRALIARGHTVYAIVRRKSANAPCAEHAIVAAPHRLLDSPFLRWISGYRAARLLNRLQPDIVHFMAEPYALLLPAFPQHSKTFLTIHGTYAVAGLSASAELRKLTADVYRAIDSIVSVSHFTKKAVRESAPQLFDDAKLREKIIVIHNGVDLSRATPTTRPMHDIRRILGVGPVKHRKGYCEAVEALAEFRRKHDVHFVYDIIGPMEEDPAYVARLKACITQHGLEDSVRIRGSVSDTELRQAYDNADAFLLLSLQEGVSIEGFGLVFLEANSWGVPVVGPTTGGCPEAIDEGKSGYVCNPYDTLSIADRLHDILVSRTIDRESCLAWARAHAIEHVAEEMEKYYRQLKGTDVTTV